MQQMKKILIADDHYIVRTGLITLIKEELGIVATDECRDGNSTLQKMQTNEYDLLILDVSMPDTDSFSLLKNVFAIRPDQKVLILTMKSEEVYGMKYLKAGAKGFLNKEEPPSEIRKAIMSVMGNRKYLSPKMRDTLIGEALEGKTQNPFNSLSTRELEIMNHLTDGKSVSEIAGILDVHISTISTHKANIMQKLRVTNVIELSRIANML